MNTITCYIWHTVLFMYFERASDYTVEQNMSDTQRYRPFSLCLLDKPSRCSRLSILFVVKRDIDTFQITVLCPENKSLILNRKTVRIIMLKPSIFDHSLTSLKASPFCFSVFFSAFPLSMLQKCSQKSIHWRNLQIYFPYGHWLMKSLHDILTWNNEYYSFLKNK